MYEGDKYISLERNKYYLTDPEKEEALLASGEETVRVIFLDPETPLGERVR